jgi:general secretion pathway protein C
MSARWWTLVVWALALASAVAWGFKVLVQAPPAPPHTQTAEPTRVASGDLTRLLGADAPPPSAAAAPEPAAEARFHLLGVVTPRAAQASREGLALIAVDGKPPRAYRVGAVVDGQTVLQSVAARGATLGAAGGGSPMALNLAPPAPATTGVPPGSAGAPPTAPGMRPLTVPPPMATSPSMTNSPGPTMPRRQRTRQSDQPEPDPAQPTAPEGALAR